MTTRDAPLTWAEAATVRNLTEICHLSRGHIAFEVDSVRGTIVPLELCPGCSSREGGPIFHPQPPN